MIFISYGTFLNFFYTTLELCLIKFKKNVLFIFYFLYLIIVMVKIVKTKNSGIQRLAWTVRNFRTGAFHFCKWLFLILICMITCKEKLFTGRERERDMIHLIFSPTTLSHISPWYPGWQTHLYLHAFSSSATHAPNTHWLSLHTENWKTIHLTKYTFNMSLKKKPEWQFLVCFF